MVVELLVDEDREFQDETQRPRVLILTFRQFISLSVNSAETIESELQSQSLVQTDTDI